ncbi:uncharacterized protein CLAFUR5_08833 [Fulvia fulva]|uniref:Uncharacterized protein n=1 Tax=Passalora fulva TaxID=5499 RepID=A0A9Q8PH89_PASFU|nr:uncharacterized protein CLAFUR5_08833 [Fulvia fulva]UJO22352.1 hypothetical protein CLAFUR5_08833 [Fulvia fulva]
MAAHFGGSRIVELPNGACGFRDLSAGGKAPICGCRRFWLNNQLGDAAFCWCGHHAVYHEFGLVNPFTPRETVQYVHTSQPPDNTTQPAAQPAPTWSELIATPAGSGNGTTNVGRPNTAGLGITDTSQPASQAHSINTKLWQALNGFARQQDNGTRSGDTTRLPSTAVPSVCDEPSRASPTRELRARMQSNRPMAPPVNIPAVNIYMNRTEDYSATEVATPSVRGTPDFRGLMAPLPRPASTPTRGAGPTLRPTGPVTASTTSRRDHAVPTAASQPTQPPRTSMGPALSIQEMCNTIQEYGRRINVLESMSFQSMPIDQLQDRFDLQDGRLLDLEHWRVEQDRAQEADDTQERLNAVDGRVVELEGWRQEQDQSKTSQETEESEKPSSSQRRRLLPMETSSFTSDASFDDENAAAHTEAVVLATLAATAETGPRIDALESRILNLESASLPSSHRLWHVQVVLLPFGRQLPGIWFSASESTRHSVRSATQALDEWSGSRPTSGTSFISTASSGVWTTESIEAWARQTQDEWLSPKACGPSGSVFQRLASRGLVRDVTLQSPDARHICSAISATFGEVLKSEEPVKDAAAKYHGLQERFIPLRKVKKSTRLRFLSSAEMLTPTSWTAEFLESSVFMKINDGERRLYLTTPEAYTQPSRPGWSWPALKDLPARDLDGEPQPAQADHNLVEACWTYNDRLDHTVSAYSSFEDQYGSPWGISTEGDAGTAAEQHIRLPSPAATRPSQLRSSSMPSATSPEAVAINVSTKRRVASFELGPVANTVEFSPEYFSTKRQRTSTSPELERRGVNFTPRWSPAEDLGPGRSSQAASNRARGTTPFAYPTPHSHFESRCGDGDTQVDEDVPPPAYRDVLDDPEEWEGMQDAGDDQHEGVHHAVHRNEEVIEGLYDEDNLEDGLAVF